MTEADRQRLAEFDALSAGWSEDQRKFGIHQWTMFLRRLITEMESAHDQRVIELLEANNDSDLNTDMKQELVEHYVFNKPLGGV